MNTSTWHSTLAEEKQHPYFNKMIDHINHQRQREITVYPPKSLHFQALKLTPLAKVRVVILGQDPYHGPGQAHGLCFSVPDGIRPPPSLKNIFQALNHDLGLTPPNHGNLTQWAQQGILLLNTVLSVEAGQAHTHANIGWERFTDRIIQVISATQPHVVFLLWGSHAQRKAQCIDAKHTQLTAPHPSPLSAHRGFLTCKHFSQTNTQLIQHAQDEIHWQLDSM